MTAHRHFILYKPDGFLSQFISTQTKRKNKGLLGGFFEFPEGTMAIGRLDEQSEGLLLLTTDGQVSELVRSAHVEKEYYVQVDGLIHEAAITALRNGVSITTEHGPYTTVPCPVFVLDQIPELPPRRKKIRDDRHGPTSWISITLREGRFRQVRKMTAVVGFPTLRLVRVRLGHIHIATMKPGDVIEVDGFKL